MTDSFARCRTVGWIAGILLALSACASSGDQAYAPSSPDVSTAAQTSAGAFPRDEAIRTLRTAYRVITTRYIDEIAIQDLALEGIRGIGTLDPELSVAIADGMVVVRYDDEDKGRVLKPLSGDVTDWAETTVDVIEVVRMISADAAASDPERVYEAILDSALSDLDIFSRYAGKVEASRNKARRDGYGGVGLALRSKNGQASVSEVYRHSPAREAGILEGDRLLKVDRRVTEGLKLSKVARLVRGKLGTKVRLEIERAGRPDPLVFVLEREHVVQETVSSTFDNGILVLEVSSFNSATVDHLAETIEQVRDQGEAELKGVVLDLRGNPGGLLKQAVSVADIFLNGGEIISAYGRHPGSHQSYQSTQPDILRERPLVVLVNGGSASSSEIVASTLQDRGRAVLVGSSSYGKGTVQTVVPLPNGGELTLTWSRLYAPSGYAFHGLGVRPTICTSGQSRSEAEKLVAQASSSSLLKATLVEWRTVSLEDAKHREALRKACPADKKRPGVDMDVAVRLLEDAYAYKHVLDVSSLAALEN